MKIKFFKREKNFKKDKKGLWLNINFYWKLAVCFMFVAVVAVAFFGYSLFVKINKELVVSAKADGNQVQAIKKERIDKVLEYFNLRKQKSDQILVSPAPVVDPSL
jgi:anti-sigma-K factor RskA